MGATGFKPTGPLLGFASRLRFPQLFFLVAALFVADLLVPDLIPFVDEALLGLLTLLLGKVRKKEPEGPAATADTRTEAEKNVTGRGSRVP